MESGVVLTLPPGGGYKVVEFLGESIFDDSFEIDLINDHCKNLYHVKGKYYVPIDDSSYVAQYRHSLEYMVHPDDIEEYDATFNPGCIEENMEKAAYPGVVSGVFRYKLQDGGWRWVEQVVVGGELVGLPEGILRGFVFDIQTKVDRQAGKSESPYYDDSSERDELTLLHHEKTFLDIADAFLSTREAVGWCIVRIDIDHFRLFNDWYGRDAGNFLLARIGSRLARYEEERGAIAGYLGRDDFSILMEYDEDVIWKLHGEIADMVVEAGGQTGFSPTMGVALLDEEAALLDCLDRSMLAMAAAKQDSEHDIRVYDDSMADHSEQAYRLLVDFKDALAEDEITFYLQPQVRSSTKRIVGAETLARWVRKDGSFVSPVEFVPVLEDAGFIVELDKCIWKKACQWLRSWLDSGHTAVPLSVNVSQRDFDELDVPEYLDGLMQSYDLPRELIKVEITETAYAENSASIGQAVARFQDKGFIVLMDDFGSGYSSLNMLGNLNVDVIKLDARFLHVGDSDGRKGFKVLESIINMAKTMNLPIITEGVETHEQADYLANLGCRYVQGFYFYRPMEVGQFEKIIADEGNIDNRGFITKRNEQFRIREFLDENIYSDAMLNSILGAVAFYSWHGEDVDIVRFNEQFYRAVHVPDFAERINQIQRFMPEGDVPKFYDVLQRAMDDPFNGASELLHFFRTDGSLSRFEMQLFFLEERDGSKLFYGSVNEVSEITMLKNQLKLFSRFSAETAVFVVKQLDSWRFSVLFHGLEEPLGLSLEQLEEELNDGSFFLRAQSNSSREMRDAMTGEFSVDEYICQVFEVITQRGNTLKLSFCIDGNVNDYGEEIHSVTIKLA